MNSSTYSWDSPAVQAALSGHGQPLRVTLCICRLQALRPALHLGGTYPPRLARYILGHLWAAGSVSPDHRNAVAVTLAGWHAAAGYRTGCLGHFDGDKLGVLLVSLFWYHRKLERQAQRLARRERARADQAQLGGLFFGYRHSSAAGAVTR